MDGRGFVVWEEGVIGGEWGEWRGGMVGLVSGWLEFVKGGWW